MDWLIWVIVIVLVVALVWWLLSRRGSTSAPADTSALANPPSASGESPRMVVEPSAAVAGTPLVAPVPVLPQPAPEVPEQAAEAAGGDVDDWEDAGGGSGEQEPVAEAVVEPVEEPVLAGPSTAEPVLDEEVPVDGVTADDVTAADAGPLAQEAAGEGAAGTAAAGTGPSADAVADKAEWEASWSDAPPRQTPGHNPEYTAPHAPTLPGAETAAAEEGLAPEVQVPAGPEGSAETPAEDAPPAGGHLAAGQPYGEGSAAAGPDGSGPADFTVKADANTMTYYDEDMPAYEEAQASVWFLSAAHAEAAGFRPPRRSRD